MEDAGVDGWGIQRQEQARHEAGYVHSPIERRARTVPIGYHNVVQSWGKWEGG